MYFDQIQSNDNTLIYGAGNGGLRLLSSLGNNSLYNVVAFIDDNLEIKNKKISGLKVYHSSNIKKIIERNNIKTLLIAIPSASNKIRKTILQKIEDINIKVLSVPNIDSVLSGKLKFSDLNNISIEELLGRDPVPPISNLLSLNIKNKNVFVSGAGGSIGSEIARQVINQGPKSLILFDISEYSLYKIHNEINSLLTDLKYTTKVYAILGTVNNNKKLKKIFKKFEIDTIYHAAAYKHVPIIEENIVEGINNNIFGTKSIVESAIEENISSFILISTDKAVRPSSIMGATKRIAELVCQSNLNTNSKTQISIVRFGNVLDSSGSVIPLFKNQITNDKPITITHKDVTRYFMTIPEAAQLVIQAGAMSDGGNIYILDMGKPIKIANIAEKIIKLYGYTPTYNKEDFNQNKSNQVLITFTGLRRGEKLHEELFIDNDFKETEHPRIISSKEKILGKKEINLILNNIEESIENNDIENLKRILNHPSIELSLDHEINDLVWNDN
jgi:FlaA1/EpsC-like NDP-sugar epimerase